MANQSLRRKNLGIWIPVILFGIFTFLSFYFSVRFDNKSFSPGDNPPWYFIQRDFFNGITMVLYLILCVAIGLIFELKYQDKQGLYIIGFSLLWASYKIWDVILILFKTQNIFDVTRATTVWKNFDEFTYDPARWIGWGILLILSASLLGYANRRLVRQ